MEKIELLLRSRLVKDALSSLLTAAGFSIVHERDSHDDHVTVIVDVDDYSDPETVGRRNGDSVVVLADESDALGLDDERIAALSGILTYDLSAEAFVRSLRLICAGERLFPKDLMPGKRRPAAASETRPDGNRLSPREREVLSHLLAGHANKVIARHLGMTEATVKVHLKNLMRKINVGNRTQAAIWATANLPELGAAARGFA